MTNYYAGIGSRKTPADKLDTMQTLARFLAHHDFVLRSGAADGADKAFEIGCDLAQGEKQIYIPWNGFNGRTLDEPNVYVGATEEALALAAKHHPNWGACTSGAKLLHARNGYQVLGHNLNEPARFVLCWTPWGSGSGGTGQAIRIARANNIPIFDLGSANVIQELDAYMASLPKPD